jgi:hypothetical protein
MGAFEPAEEYPLTDELGDGTAYAQDLRFQNAVIEEKY